MNEPLWVSAVALRQLHAVSLARFGGAAGVRDAGLLDSALARPRNLFAYGETDICVLAAALAHGVVRNRAFVDGNKRAALLGAALLLELNGFRFVAGEADAALMTLGLAAGVIGEAEFVDWLRANARAR